MNQPRDPPSVPGQLNNPTPTRIVPAVLSYIALAAVWILAFEWVVGVNPGLIPPPAAQPLKDWGLVVITTALLYYLLRQRRACETEAVEHAKRYAVGHLLEAIAEGSSDAIFAKDLHGRYVLFNRAAGLITGKNPEEVLGQHDGYLFPDAQAQGLTRSDAQVVAANRCLAFEQTLTTAHGERVFLVTKGPLQGPNGSVSGIFGIGHDITEQKAAEIALRESESRYRSLVDSSQDWVWVIDRSGQHLYFNAVGPEALGYSSDDFAGFDPATLIHPDDQTLYQVTLQQALDSGRGWRNVVLRWRGADGSYRDFESNASPIVSPSGELQGFQGIDRDITDRRRQWALESELAVLQDLLESTLAGYWDWNIPAGTEYLSPAFKRMFGYQDHELPNTPETWQALIFEEDLPGMRDACERHITSHGGQPFYQEARYRHKDGSTVWVICAGKVIEWGADSQPVRMVGCHIDITRLKELEIERERRSDARFQRLFDAAPIPLCFIDKDGRVINVNDRFEQLSGYAQRDLPTLAEWWPLAYPDPDYRQQVMAIWGAAVQRAAVGNGVIEPLEFRVTRKDREIRTVLISGRLVGEDLLVAGVDITDRKRTETELRDSEARLRAITESAQDAILVMDAQGAISYWNPAAETIFGYPRDEALGQDLHLLLAPEHYLEAYTKGFEAFRQTGRGTAIGATRELVARRKDGLEITVSLSLSALLIEDQWHAVGIARDITHHKAVDEELAHYRRHLEDLVASRTSELALAKEAAEAANQAKSVFLSNMSHEIRTPMNAIVGLTHLLARGTLDPQHRDWLHKIDAAAGHLLEIINDILDLSKIEAGKLTLDEQDFSPATLLEEVSSLFRDKLAAKGLDYCRETDSLPETLHGDATRLRQALVNYLGNALKFTERGGVKLRAEVIGKTDTRVQIRFAVSDTGVGISPEMLSRLFEPFVQADASTTRRYGGTGLGLSITRRLVALMGGEVGVDSEPQCGSTFWFTVPLAMGKHGIPDRPPESRALAEDGLRFHHAGCRVLLAEDNRINQEVALELLREAGLIVDLAENGLVAVQRAREQTYDLILMDVQMPELNGYEATEAIRALPGWETIPILAMTANAFDEDRQKCLDAGMNDFVAKPVDPALLFAVLEKWLSVAGASARRVDGVPVDLAPRIETAPGDDP